MEASELQDILGKYSTKCYSIEYDGFFSNHISHGIVALASLGASKERIEQFVVWYARKLEKPEQQPREVALPEENQKNPDAMNYGSLLGKRKAYYPLLEYYKKNFQDDCKESMETFISKHLVAMIDGICCSALHPLIHLGYAYSVRNPELVIEGIAYLHHSHVKFPIPTTSSFGQGTRDMFDVLEDVRKNEKLCSFDQSDLDKIPSLFPDWKTGGFQKKMAISATFRSEEISTYVDQIQLPQWFNPSEASMPDILKLCDWIIDSAVAVYTASEKRNDFFLLHGVTAAWSLKQAISAMKGLETKVLISCIQHFVCAYCATYIVQKSPKMIKSYLTEPEEKSWEQIIEEAVKSEIDEHIYKMVQVCHERAMTYPTDQQNMFKRASLFSMEFKFIF